MSLDIKYGCLPSFIYGLLNIVVFTYDIITFPVYWGVQSPGTFQRKAKEKKAIVVDEGSGYITYKTTKKPSHAHLELNDIGVKTMAEVFSYIVRKYANKDCLGTRKILGERDEEQPNGKVFKKYVLGEYQWQSFNDVGEQATNFGKGLRELGIEPGQPIAMLAETQAKWLIAANGAFKHNFPLVTIYATLGDDGIIHAINETEVNTVITTYAQLPKLKDVLQKTPTVKTLVYMEDQLHELKDKQGFKEDLHIVSFNKVLEMGKNSSVGEIKIAQDDIAIIMYTSGSTGVPKGVKLLHKNLIAALKAFVDCTKILPTDIFVGYLPLAHVLELLAENGLLFCGCNIGYSSAQTLIDNSTKIQRGTKGDVSELKPTFSSGVPLVLDRIAKAIRDKVDKLSGIQKAIFKFGYNYKKKWLKRGYKTPLTDRIIFKATKAVMGGRLRVIAAGGAPLTPETQEMINICLCMNVLQGYGLTETTSCCSNQDVYDTQFGRVGPPMTTALVRLVNWEEGNYSIKDKPYPRGEILVGGDIVSAGYYKNDAKTNEEFFTDNGVRWFRTGDIGEVHEDGSLKIIDRKKDLVKLQAGEYLSLGKVESLLRTCGIIDNICVYAESTKNSCIALVVANPDQLTKLAAEQLKITNKSFIELCDDPEVTKTALQVITKHATSVKLERFEIPQKIKLVKEVWLPETDLVTATFKLKRKEIQNYYKNDIEKMYS